MDVSELMRIKDEKLFIRHPWETARSKVITSLIKKNIPNNLSQIIDIGSGDAFVLNQLAKQNLATIYSGIDTGYTNITAKEKILKSINSQIKLYNSLQQGFHLTGSENELILLMDVLEHQQNDDSLLKEIIETSKQQHSYLLITVPAFNSIYSRHDELLQHTKRYNRKELIQLCKKNNLPIINSGYFFTSLLLVRCIGFIWEKIIASGKQTSIEVWDKNSFISSIFEKFLLLDYKISCIFKALGINLPGLSCYCICKI